MIQIIKVKRYSDNKIFQLGDEIYVDGIFRGFLDGIDQFQDDFRIHVDVDEESMDLEYYSIYEVD